MDGDAGCCVFETYPLPVALKVPSTPIATGTAATRAGYAGRSEESARRGSAGLACEVLVSPQAEGVRVWTADHGKLARLRLAVQRTADLSDRRSNRSSSEGRSPGGEVVHSFPLSGPTVPLPRLAEGGTVGPFGRKYRTFSTPPPGPRPSHKGLTGFQPARTVLHKLAMVGLWPPRRPGPTPRFHTLWMRLALAEP